MTRKFMTPVVLPANPVGAMEATTKQYVDGLLASGFTFIQEAVPTATVPGSTWYRTSDGKCLVWYDSFWVEYAPGAGSSAPVPLGTIIDYYGNSAPWGFLECNGSTFVVEDYPYLNDHLGGNTLPDLRDRSTIGASATAGFGTSKGSANSSVPQHQHASTLAAPAHTHPDDTTILRAGSAGATQLPVDAASFYMFSHGAPATNTGPASATALTGSIGNISGATAAVAGSNYHPVMAVLKCIKATH